MMSFYLWLLVHLFACPTLTQRSSRALYPSAFRIKRGAYWLLNPTFQSSQKDVDLLFEILLAGTQLEDEDRQLWIPDEELASLRQARTLEVICEDVLPQTLAEGRRLVAQLSRRSVPLSWEDYERTVLTLVKVSQTVAHLNSERSRQAWEDLLIQLFRALHKDLVMT